MAYILDYNICALVIIFSIALHFFTNRQFPNLQNRLFGFALIAAFFDILLDMLGSLTIAQATTLPAWVNYAVNTVFYSFQLLFIVILFVHAAILTKQFRKEIGFLAMVALPVLLLYILLIANLFLPIIFTVNPIDGYVHLPAFVLLYVAVFLYVAATMILITVKRRVLSRPVYFTFIICLILCAATTMIQVFLPRYLLTGMGIAVFMLMMYLVSQKPGNMLDSVSHMFNRNALNLFLRDTITERRAYSLIHIRVDNISRIDRMIGYLAGDRIVQNLGEFFNHKIENGWGFRLSGSQFLIVCRGRENYERIFSVITHRFDEPWFVKEAGISLATTICGVPDTRQIESVEEMLELLETVVRELPGSSRTTVDLRMIDSLKHQAWVEAALIDSLDRGIGFEIHYQPIFERESGRYAMAEALLRFTYQGKMISPGEFIPIAERCGQILRVDEMVLRKVCAFLRESGVAEKYGLKAVEVNLSAIEFLYEKMPARIEKILEEFEIPSDTLVFEITETAATSDYDALETSMKSLCASGYSFALDDFGTGYANITQVARLPFRIAKLDRSMLTAIETHVSGNVIYRNVINMFDELGLSTVAEGIETAEQAREVLDLKVDYMQGYHFAKPMSEKDYLAFLEAHHQGEARA